MKKTKKSKPMFPKEVYVVKEDGYDVIVGSHLAEAADLLVDSKDVAIYTLARVAKYSSNPSLK